MCGVSRLILPAILAGAIAGTLANQALAGWAAGAAVAVVLYLMGRRQGGPSWTLLTGSSRPAADSDAQPGEDGEPSRVRATC